LARENRSHPARERTEEERTRAREERERRRAGEPAADGPGDPTKDAPAPEYGPPASVPVTESVELPSKMQPPVVPAEPRPAPIAAEIPLPAIPTEHAIPTEQAIPTADTTPSEDPTADAMPAAHATPSAEAIPTEDTIPTEDAIPADDAIPAEDAIPPAKAIVSEQAIPTGEAVRAPIVQWAPPPPRDGPPAPGGQARASRPHRARRSLPARTGAVLALVAAAAVVWLLVESLDGSGHTKTVAPPAVLRVLIPEGETRLQIAQLAAADGLTGSYRAASRHSRLLNPAHYGAPRNTPDLEGFLFPATYDMNPGAPVSQLVDKQLTAFRQRFGAREIRRARELGVSAYELLTVASMVEREAQTSHDRPLVAAVIYNRLRQEMPLGIDATIYYAVELQKGIATYTQELSEAQLHIESPYNTRTHTGLPPTPISNPGLASIEAAAHPAQVSYLYYVAAADGCGEQAFSTSAAAFERNVAAYKAAVQKNGARPPTCKKK
jgi:UPF0755 protein